MSRRQSRVSIDARQHDTLLEFETFKKKFLLANKHITKLNSTLSARIEELNAQISTLYVENLRLRASEIALTSQLKKEREKSRKVLADAESATHNLMKQLGFIRKSCGISHRSPSPEVNPPLPRAKRPIPDPNVSPPPNRIARPPTIPVLVEDDEPNMSSPEDGDEPELESSPTPSRKRKTKSRTSSSASSRLPVPLSKPPADPVEIVQIDFDGQLGNSGKRRPTRRQSGLLTSVSITAVTADGLGRPPSPVPSSPVRIAMEEDELAAAEPDEDEVEAILQAVAKRERKAKREQDAERMRQADSDAAEASRPRERKKHRVTEDSADVVAGSKSRLKDVTNSQASRSALPQLDTTSDRERRRSPDADEPTSATSLASTSTRNFLSTPATTPAPSSKPASHLPTPRSSSPVAPPPQPDPESALGGRERRVRKSVNYAEPKLNTKMRKPDPPPGSKRTSLSASGAQDDPLPNSSRSSSSNTADADADPVSAGSIKRKKSRTYTPPDDEDESEGTQADAEFGSLRAGAWSNVEPRRRSVHSSGTRRLDGDDLRRHSMAT
ncbi:hypothetical protein OH76DRAFT_1405971 [Lentinus brumalis]|uniref:Shugoshin C-terminal domain-containing protein n=1 Tax=Lentinus brumalis TaxID=2498619 RepID=A0A371D4C8_9APHY|nr:hypothetical protein OH76DRAFT_1405971 [Polyporus brumalis]